MNMNDIWSGSDYAHTDNISRGVAYYERANRVKAMRVYKEKADYYNSRLSTFVEVIMLNDDGTPKKMYDGVTDVTRTVRARDIFMRWEEYAAERKHRNEKREQIAQEEAAKRVSEEDKKAALIDALSQKFNGDFDALWITSMNDYSVSISRHKLEEWLGVS